ncbi:MAG: putative chromosome partitioning protein, partial [Phycisphaerales bacterium]|nr:putative chromosome partitioning protein [Phycisphaerales bacterium]
KLKEAASFGQPITEYDPGSRGYKDFVNLARELMGHRPADIEPVVTETLSRPAELVQRAKQLAQLTNFQFGKNAVSFNADAPLDQKFDLRTTQQKIDAFYGIRFIDGDVHFAAKFAEARRVQVAGDFNGWSSVSTPLTSPEPGRWIARLPLQAGRYKYRFVVDGVWTNDPHNPATETNEFGELNNVVEVA